MAEQSRQEMLRTITADDINAAYKNHDITKRDQLQLLREKGHAELDDVLSENGYFSAIFKQSMKNYQKGWENLIDAATNKSDSEGFKQTVGEDVYNMGLGAAAMIQMAFAPLSAFGEVNGAKAEKMALAVGVSPGAASWINTIVDIGSGFIPMGVMARSFARTVGVASKAAGKAAGKVDDAAEEASKITLEDRNLGQALVEALKRDGVENAEKAVGKIATATPTAPLKVAEKVEKSPDFITLAERITKRTSKDDAIAGLSTLKKKFGIDDESMTISTSLFPTRTMTERQLYGHLKALDEQVDEVGALAQKALTGNEIDAVNFARFVTQLFTGQSDDKVRYSKDFVDFLAHWDADSVARGDLVGAMRSLAEDLSVLTTKELADFSFKNQQGFLNLGANWWGISKELYANILLPLATPAATVGNSITTGLHMVDNFVGAAFSANRQNGLVMREGVYFSKGLMFAMEDAFKLARDQFFERGSIAANNRFSLYREIPGVAGRVIRKPTDALIAMDTFFGTILERASFYAQYAREGVHAGLKGQALGQYVTSKMANAWPPPVHIWREAESLKLDSTFQNQLGTLGQAFNTITQNSPAFFYFPFFKSFANLTKYSWNRTPGLQLLSKSLYDDLRAGGARADDAIGRLTTSNLIGMYLFELAKEGYITGRGPVDPALRKSWLATHEPYSIKTSKGWLQPGNIDPATQPMGFIADFVEVIDQLDEPTAGQIGEAIVYSIMKNYVDKGSWHTVGGLMEVVHKYSTGQELTAQDRDNLLSPFLTVTTGGPVGLRITRAIDPIMHETRTFVDSWRARVPGFSDSVPPRRDGYGDVMVPSTTPGTNWFGLFSPLVPKFKDFQADPVKLEGDRVGAKLPNFEWSIGGDVVDDLDLTPPRPGAQLATPLTADQRDKWQQIYGNLINHPELGIEAQLLKNERYVNGTPALKRVLFEGLLADYKSTAGDILIEQDSMLQEKMKQNDIKSVLPLTNDPAQRLRLNNMLNQSIDLFTNVSDQERNNLLKWGNPETILPKETGTQQPVTYDKATVEATTARLFPGVPFSHVLRDDTMTKALQDDLDLQTQKGGR